MADGSETLPTPEELQKLEAKLAHVSTSDSEGPMWTVVVLRGGLLDSLYFTQYESVSRTRFDATCRLLGVRPDDPCNEDYEVYHDSLTRIQHEYCW